MEGLLRHSQKPLRDPLRDSQDSQAPPGDSLRGSSGLPRKEPLKISPRTALNIVSVRDFWWIFWGEAVSKIPPGVEKVKKQMNPKGDRGKAMYSESIYWKLWFPLTFLFYSAYFRNPLRESLGIQYKGSHRECLKDYVKHISSKSKTESLT